MSCFVSFSLRSVQLTQERRRESASWSAAVMYLSSTNTSSCCPRDFALLWHVFTGAAHRLCLCSCSAAAPPPTVLPHSYMLRLKLFQPFFVFLAADESSWTCLPVGSVAVSQFGWWFTRRAGLLDVPSHRVEVGIHFTAGFTHFQTHFLFCYIPLDLFNGFAGTSIRHNLTPWNLQWSKALCSRSAYMKSSLSGIPT